MRLLVKGISDIRDWRYLEVTDGGDRRIRAQSRAATTGDSRDASWVQVYLLKFLYKPRTHVRQFFADRDIYAHRPNTPSVFIREKNYGFIKRILSFTLPACASIPALVSGPRTFAYAELFAAKLDEEDDLGLGVRYYTDLEATSMVDVRWINRLVGRVKLDDRRWAIVDRDGAVAPDDFIVSDDDDD
jgi:hypothetical protein